MKGSLYKRGRKSPPEDRGVGGKRFRTSKGWEKSPSSMRRAGLLSQFLERNKTSVVVDSRIGEKTHGTEEEKIARRMATEKSKHYGKKTVFNLNDEEDELTHKGLSVENVERYDDPRDHSGSEDELLDKDFVGEAHFGGFLKIKKKDAPELMDVDEKQKSRKEIIEELIIANKAKKLEKARHGDEYLSKVGNLNNMFKEEGIMSLVQSTRTKKEELESIMAKNTEVEEAGLENKSFSSPNETFGRILRELKFEAKPARVDQVQVHGLASSEDMGMNWEVPTGDIPIPIPIPSTYTAYSQFLAKYSMDFNDAYDQERFSYIHDKMIDNHLVSHRGKLSDLCEYLLRFTLELANTIDIYDTQCVAAYTPYLLHRIIQASPDPVILADIFVVKVKEAHARFISKTPRKLLDSDVALLAICSHVFDNSEVRHRVLSLALIFLFQILSEFNVTDSKTARQILQLCYEGYTFVQGTGRYSPEIMTSLCSLLKCFDNSNSLSSATSGLHYLLNDRNDVYASYDIIIPILALLKKFLKLYSTLPSGSDIFKPISDVLNVLKNRAWIECEWPGDFNVTMFQKNMNDIIISIQNLTAEREPPRTALELPKPLRLYEPEFQEVFTGKKRAGSRGQQDHARLLHKIKQEQKGAIRELKKDAQFLARAQQQQQTHLDNTRKRKVNLILGSLSNQEGDFKKLRRGK